MLAHLMLPIDWDPGSRLKLAIAGYGYWGPNLARVAGSCPGTELKLICDRSEEATERARLNHPTATVTRDWDDVLQNDQIDAVVIALPVQQHFQYALEALQGGKHVLVEKPLAGSVAECDKLASQALQSDLVLMVGHTFEYHAAVERVKRYLDSGELGVPYYIAMRRTNLGIVRSDSNALWSLAPHDVSILCNWLDAEPLGVSASGLARLQQGIEDVVFMTIEFERDVLAHVHTSWLNPSKVREATVVGSEKMVVYDDVSMDAKVRLYDKGIVRAQGPTRSLGRYEDFARYQLLVRAGDVVIPKIDFREPLVVEIEHFAECALTGVPPRTGAANGRRVVAVLEAAQRSIETGASERITTALPGRTPA